MLRELLDRFQPGDVLLADRYYCSYFLIVLLMELGIDFVVRLHQRRDADFQEAGEQFERSKIDVAVPDRQGNVSRIERRFSIVARLR